LEELRAELLSDILQKLTDKDIYGMSVTQFIAAPEQQ
jgi:hypothetical protein